MKQLTLLCICLWATVSIQAQETPNPIPIRITLFTHSVGMPLKKAIKKPLNWGVSVGTTLFYRKGSSHSLGQGIDLAWYRHKELGQGVMLTTSLRYEYTSSFGLSVGPILSAGYLMTFSENDTYSLNSSGEYEKISLASRSAAVVGLGARLGFDLGKVSDLPLKPYVEYDWKAQFPHSQFTFIFPHSMVHVGAAYSLRSKK